MIKELVKQWEENKYKLEDYFRNTKQSEYQSYETIVKKLFELCIPNANDYYSWDLNKMTTIDDGDYQGTQIFIIPMDTYQPSMENYVVTNTFYGSCSGCDTLQAIQGYEDNKPNENQIKSYMTLALHLVQRIKYL